MSKPATPEQKEKFQKIVLNHMKSMPKNAWDKYRRLAGNDLNKIDPDERFDPNATPESIVKDSFCSCFMVPVDATRGMDGSLKEIGDIDGQSVFYAEGMGYYIWGPDMNSSEIVEILDISITWPAYPPGF